MYEIMMNGKQVGTVDVHRKGLYYYFSCVCDLPDKNIYRIYLNTEKNTRNMGVCVPEGNKLILKTKIPVKHFKDKEFAFFMTDGNGEKRSMPVESGKEFPFLHMLEDACLQTENGQQVILISQYQDLPDNGQNQEHLSKLE